MTLEGIIGIVITILLAYLGIWYTKKLRDRHSLTLINDEWFSLLTTFQGKFETLKISFNQLPTTTNLYYYRGSILNTGTLDIDKSRMYAPLEIDFPENCIIKECKVVSEVSENFFLKESTNANKISFEWDLLKPMEHFLFECIVESTKPVGISEITIKHRITDLRDIDKINAWTITATKLSKFIWKNLGTYLAFLFFLSLSFFWTYRGIASFINPDVNVEHQIRYSVDSLPATVKSIDKNNVLILHNNKRDTTSIKDVTRFIYLQPMVTEDKDKYSLVIIGGLCFLGILWGTIIMIMQQIREYGQIKLLGNMRKQSTHSTS